MEEQILSRLFKRNAESAEEGAKRNLTRTFIEEKKLKASSPVGSVQGRSLKASSYDSSHRNGRAASSGPMIKLRSQNDCKIQRQMDVKHTTMLTNLASSYYEKVKPKPSPEHNSKLVKPKTLAKYRSVEDRATENLLNSIQKIKLKESVLDARLNDNFQLTLTDHLDEDLYFVVKSGYSSSTEDSVYNSDVTLDEMNSTDVDVSSLQNDLSYSKGCHRRNEYVKEKKIKKTNSKNAKKPSNCVDVAKTRMPFSASINNNTSASCLKNKNSLKGKIKHQKCSTEIKTLSDTGTNPSFSLLSQLYDENKAKNQKSSIPVKCQKTFNKNVIDSMQKMKFIIEEVKELCYEIDMFTGTSVDHRDYVYMDEVMMRNLIKLDNIETYGNDVVKAKRKEAIQFIQTSMNRLQKKLTENQASMDVDEISVSLNDSLENVKLDGRKIHSSIRISESH